MAFSQPLTDSMRKKVQTAMICQLCENDSKSKWKCVECGLLMCQRCRDKVHPKFPSAENHTIIDIKEVGRHQTELKANQDLTRIRCRAHSGQNCCLYCKTCQELVCQTCITKTHNKHEFGDINDEYKIIIEKVRDEKKKAEKERLTLKVSEQKLKQSKLNEQENYVTVKQSIIDYDKALKREIQKHTENLLKKLDLKWEAVCKSFEIERRNLNKKLIKIQQQLQEIDSLLNPNNAKDAFPAIDFLLKSFEINVSSVNASFEGVPKFIHGDKTRIPLILGELEEVSLSYSNELEVNSKFETDLKHITSVLSSSDGSIWLCDAVSDIVQIGKLNANKINVLSNFNVNVAGASLLSSGDLLLSNGSSLKLISFGTTVIQDSVYKVSPFLPSTVHVTCDNKVIVGAVNTYAQSTGPKQVIVMDQTGHHEKVFQYDKDRKPLFTYPRYIASNSEGTIAVVDWDSNKHRVIVMNKVEADTNIYTGHPEVNNDANPFKPTGITTTPLDNFVVADTFNYTLHILNSEGDIITFCNTKSMGILLPWSY